MHGRGTWESMTPCVVGYIVFFQDLYMEPLTPKNETAFGDKTFNGIIRLK